MMDVPKHVAIILDGNRRYAKSIGKNSWEGHEYGAKALKEVVDEAAKLNIEELSLYTFSTENFNRPKIEIDFLMNLFKRIFSEIEKNKEYLKSYKIIVAGDKSLFSKDIQRIMGSIDDKTKDNKGMRINFCMGYGGRNEILNAFKKIINKNVKSEDITEKVISENLYVSSDIDLMIRTGGEKRTSGFLPWQSVYAEIIFLDKMWPDFTRKDLNDCVDEFNNRKRRFGR